MKRLLRRLFGRHRHRAHDRELVAFANHSVRTVNGGTVVNAIDEDDLFRWRRYKDMN